MTGIDSSEIILLLLIGLVVLGPRRLPEIANKVGSWLGQARRMTRALKRQLEEELSLDEKPSIHTPVMPPPPQASRTPGPLGVTDEPEPHIPNDDDTYSPLHDDEPQDEKSA